jgi:hypothetical protein
VTTRVRLTAYSGQSYHKSRPTSVLRTRVETPTIVSGGCGTTCPHTTIDSPAGLRCHAHVHPCMTNSPQTARMSTSGLNVTSG